MNEELAHRVGAAARAAWWTILVAVLFLTVQWLVFLAVARCPRVPCWMSCLWGGADWTTIRTAWLWLTGVFKLVVWLAAMLALWLSLWARRLRRA